MEQRIRHVWMSRRLRGAPFWSIRYHVCQRCGAHRPNLLVLMPWTGKYGGRMPYCAPREWQAWEYLVPDFKDVWGGAGPDNVRAGYSPAI